MSHHIRHGPVLYPVYELLLKCTLMDLKLLWNKFWSFITRECLQVFPLIFPADYILHVYILFLSPPSCQMRYWTLLETSIHFTHVKVSVCKLKFHSISFLFCCLQSNHIQTDMCNGFGSRGQTINSPYRIFSFSHPHRCSVVCCFTDVWNKCVLLACQNELLCRQSLFIVVKQHSCHAYDIL